ncbi:Lrp/AsnC family transcriptional regulator [Nanchangia anserum]|uniref:Lrp/AsnC family transcriptional regulator n=1 Tax=Nanchangia anserum TaxID=2692125 RepID=A0A8I0G7N0_9ACTO|nr:Lrp/AsnC family transcriptional regulator [Nanchangia anserum]MBD3689370.1 Lrp/AsnC family transcriptional regulator [Nanchangia anserum]QOX81577.1 Lrp/AsnC family transcriptional regulator [Nanchangia anserum]
MPDSAILSTAVGELDTPYLELIDALRIAPRASWAELSAVLATPASTLRRRYRRLIENNVMRMGVEFYSAASASELSFVTIEADPAQREDVLDALCRIPEIVFVEDLLTVADAACHTVTPTLRDLHVRTTPQLRAIPGIRRIHVLPVTTLHVTGAAWSDRVINPSQRHRLERLGTDNEARRPQHPPSALERAGIGILARDARVPISDFARRLDLSATTARRLLRGILSRDDVRIRLQTSPAYLGYPIVATFYCHCAGERTPDLAVFAREHLHARMAASVVGTVSFLFACYLTHIGQTEQIQRRLRQSFPDVTIGDVALSMRRRKDHGWIFDAHDRIVDHDDGFGMVW